MSIFVGRAEESRILRGLTTDNEPHLVAIMGRRRVGKTYLINQVYTSHLVFNHTGSQDVSKEEQLSLFISQLNKSFKTKKSVPETWNAAFDLLSQAISRKKRKRKKVIFLDELPWMATRRSGFLSAFAHFWNNWAVRQNIIIVICGSATSWMIKNIINNKKGLHNRITTYIRLKPFTLSETAAYLYSKNIKMPRHDIIEIYMAMGGIPHYLKEIRGNQSVAQNIDRICFSENGILKWEFNNLYRSLFESYESYEEVIRAISKKRKGLTRKEISELTSLTNGGGLTRILKELEECSFIERNLPFGKVQRNTLYRVVDEYSIFYLTYIEKNQKAGKGAWVNYSTGSKYKSWAGFAFESVCFKHIDAIKHKLGISGVYTELSSSIIKGESSTKGTQIDLIIDRNDNTINLCEIKYYSDYINLNKSQAERLRSRRELFRSKSKIKKYLMTTLITTYGLKTNSINNSIIDSVITMDDLFVETN